MTRIVLTRIVRAVVVTFVTLGPVGCGGSGSALQHPLTNELDPNYSALDLRTLAALPFASDISDDQDPDGLAAPMVASTFYVELNRNTGFTILPESEVARILEQEGMDDDLDDFYKDWLSDQWEVDEDFIKRVAETLNVDAVVGGAVDVWYQDAVDITESGSARTQVGVLVGLFDGPTGKRLWLGRDENSVDGLRYPGMGNLSPEELQREMERTNQRTVGGAYAPPDYAVVVGLVIQALIDAFPPATP